MKKPGNLLGCTTSLSSHDGKRKQQSAFIIFPLIRAIYVTMYMLRFTSLQAKFSIIHFVLAYKGDRNRHSHISQRESDC